MGAEGIRRHAGLSGASCSSTGIRIARTPAGTGMARTRFVLWTGSLSRRGFLRNPHRWMLAHGVFMCPRLFAIGLPLFIRASPHGLTFLRIIVAPGDARILKIVLMLSRPILKWFFREVDEARASHLIPPLTSSLAGSACAAGAGQTWRDRTCCASQT